jgi:2-polyprenyl-3-methyl-5-hydroxy-6-metoxy-1,4-benzoquinol methylase
MPDSTARPDPEKLQQKQALLGGIAMGAVVAAMISLGMRLGLYRVLAEAGPATSEELANASGLHERWVREWLRGQAAARIVEYDGHGRFELAPETGPLLVDADSLLYMGASFLPLPQRIGIVERLPDAFRTGRGLSWDDRGPDAPAATELMFGNWYRQVLVPVALPMLEGVVPRLEAGGKVADVGCGAGIALIEMAKAYPRAEFHGYEVSTHALERAGANRAAAGVANVTFHQARTDPLPTDHSFDLITTFDCLHDMTDPDSAAHAVYAALKPDGAWFIVDINGQATFEENLARNPLSPTLYALSVLSCMSSALSEPGGAGLGTLGLPEPAMRELVARAGCTRFRRLDLKHPINAYYEARP